MNEQHYQKYILIGGVSLAVILLIVTIVLTVSQKRQAAQEAQMAQTTQPGQQVDANGGQTPQQNVVTSQEVKQPPAVTFTAPVVSSTQTVAVPAQVPLYHFGKYTTDDINRIAGVLGYTQQKVQGTSVIAYNTEDPAHRGWIMVDTARGVLVYHSYSGEVPPLGTSPQASAQAFLTKLGVVDSLVDCNITYQRSTEPEATQVECHRNWQKTGLPIINFVGLLNVSETTRLSDIQPGRVYPQPGDGPDDTTVVNTSTGQDGYRRPDEFNTATVAIAQDGSVLDFTSNIRPIQGKQMVAAADILTSQQALDKVSQNQADLSFYKPVGNGIVNYDVMFPDNKAQADSASVTDIMLAYVESPSAQEYLAPMYVIRGQAHLTTDYNATFLKAVAATKIGLSAAATSGSVAGVSDSLLADDALHLGTFGFQPDATPTPMAGDCLPSESQLYPLVDLPGYGRVGPFTINSDGQKRANNYFLIPANPNAIPELNSVVSLFDTLNIEDPRRKSTQLREQNMLEKEWLKYSYCPLRLTGSSPTIFVSGQPGTKVAVQTGAKLTYQEPASANNSWTATVQANGSVQVGSQTSPYLYYEYQSVAFTHPTQGWNIQKSSLSSFARTTLKNSLRLTDAEADRMGYELRNAAHALPDGMVFVGPISGTELAAKVPLTVTSKELTAVNRVHFYVGAARSGAQAPKLIPVTRGTATILEVGAAAGK